MFSLTLWPQEQVSPHYWESLKAAGGASVTEADKPKVLTQAVMRNAYALKISVPPSVSRSAQRACVFVWRSG